MTPHYHALVWIDHREAKVFQFDATDVDRSTVRSTHPDQHLHHKANSGDSGHAPLDKEFLKHVAQALSTAGAILITGPAGAKTELDTYIKQTQPELAKRISGVEALEVIAKALAATKGFETPLADWRVHATAAVAYRVIGNPQLASRHAHLAATTRRQLVESLPPRHRLRTLFETSARIFPPLASDPQQASS